MASFHELSQYAFSSIPTEFEWICKLEKRFTGYLYKATTSLVLSGGTFQSTVDHARIIRLFDMLERVGVLDG